MIYTFEILMVDLLFILLIALFTEMLLDTKKYSKIRRVIVYVLSYSMALVFNFIFTVKIDGQFTMDLRHTVFLIGGLYGGLYTLPVLALISFAYIGVFAPHEAMANGITIIIECVIISLLSNYYHRWRLRKKLITTGFTVFAAGYLIMKIVQYFFQFTTGYDLLIISIYGGSIIVIIYAMEWVRNSIMIKTRIQRAEKLEAISHLAASISHEIRNPLTVTKGFLQLLESEEYPFEKKREYFSLAKSELIRAERIISGFLTFAKPAQNTLEVINVSEELEHIIAVLNPLANMNSVIINASLRPGMVEGEKPLFQQCILNILKNAIESMEENGGTLKITAQVKDKNVQIQITDTGVGMDKKQIERLGEPYFSLKGKNGTGLGMMMVYSIVKSMNGTIEVDSSLGWLDVEARINSLDITCVAIHLTPVEFMAQLVLK